MNPGLVLGRDPVILKDRDLAGELKDVWLAVQNKREREKGMSQDVMYKVCWHLQPLLKACLI